jgi:hypothetical protein
MPRAATVSPGEKLIEIPRRERKTMIIPRKK